MEEMIKTVEAVLKQVQAEPYTPYRDASIGALQSFLEKAPMHQEALKVQAALKGQPKANAK